MPRLKPPRSQEVPLPPEDHTPPTEPIEIVLEGDITGPTEIELASEPPPSPPAPEPPPAPPESPLQQQVDAQARAEQLQRDNAEMQRQLSERDQALQTERTRGDDAEYNSVLTAIAAEQAVLDKAEADAAAYSEAGDFRNAAKMHRIIGATAARLDRLEDGKSAFEQRREATPAPAAAAPAPAASAPLDFEQQIAKMPESAKSWLRKHPEFIQDPALNAKIGNAHAYLVNNKGLEAFSTDYFDAIDNEFGFKAAAPAVEPQPQRRSMPVSAPVSRDVPTASGQREPSSKVTLNQEERLIARTSFTNTTMTNEQKERLYAQNKQKLAQRRANGSYPMSERN